MHTFVMTSQMRLPPLILVSDGPFISLYSTLATAFLSIVKGNYTFLIVRFEGIANLSLYS